VLFNIITNIDPVVHTLFPATASINPRVKAASEAPVLKLLADADFITPAESRRDRFYQEVARPLDVPFICLTNLERTEDSFTALAAVRSQRDGHITGEQREIFACLAPHVRSAVWTHRALEGHGTAVLTGAMETLSIPAFVCDRGGRVKSLTLAAEALVTSGLGLQLKRGQLLACEPNDAKALANAIGVAQIGLAVGGPPVLRTVLVRGRDPRAPPLVLDVFPLPLQPYQFSFDPRVMVVVRNSRGAKARRAAFLESAYSLTSAESEIAQNLAEGQSADSIAAEREVAVGTVRAQIKTIMAKIGVSRQVELVVRLSQL
jgi:DNA-binding CsgD family transcriptional regulator